MLYKDILWIDDIDKSDSDVADLEEEKNEDNLFVSTDTITEPEKEQISREYFKNSFHNIRLIRWMQQAFNEIIDNYDKYNLVIFDLNMRNGWNNPNERKELAKKFESYNIKYPDEDENAGIYLYLLLLTKGYPASRMIIYTGNQPKTLYNNFSYLNLENITKYKDEKLDPEEYYEKDSYYRIRRLVQQGCHYWKNKIKESAETEENPEEQAAENIAFNKIYFSGNKRNRISIANFLELLDRVEMMFPVVPPENPDKVYYQAARILSEYHENSADIKKLNNYEDLYTFHLVCRSFRNWSSHNKFAKAEMTAKIFAVIFCIALRTYFDEKQNEDRHYVPELKYYEEIYFSKKDISEKEYNNVCETIKNKLTENISLVKFFSSTKQDIQGNQGNKKYSHLVYIWGEENNKADVQDVLMPIIVKDKNIPIANNQLQELKVCSLLSANNFSAANEQSEEEISGTQCIQEGISTDNEQSDEITFIDLIVRSSIELWIEKPAENKQEASP